MTASRLAIIGGGDLGQTLQSHLLENDEFTLVGFFDDTRIGQTIGDAPVLGGLDSIVAAKDQDQFDCVVLGIGYRHLQFRQTLFESLSAAGVEFARVIHPKAIVSPNATVGPGSVIFPGCILDTGVVIGCNSLLNVGCVVAHDSEIGPHSFLGPSVSVAGFVKTGARCFLGIGTVLIDNLQLGDDCQTAGGAVVIRNVEARQMVAGVPAVVKKEVVR